MTQTSNTSQLASYNSYEMIKANPTRLGRAFWGLFTRIGIKLYFRTVIIEAPFSIGPHQSVLLIGNHISWWDGFWALRVNQLVFQKKFYIMMLEEQLRQRKFMREGGAYSIAPGNRSMVKSLTYTEQLLKDSRNLVVMYPQGKIHSMYDTEIRFQKGICRVLDRVVGHVAVVFFALHLEFMAHARPSLHVRCIHYPYQKGTTVKALEAAYQAHYTQSLRLHIEQNKV